MKVGLSCIDGHYYIFLLLLWEGRLWIFSFLRSPAMHWKACISHHMVVGKYQDPSKNLAGYFARSSTYIPFPSFSQLCPHRKLTCKHVVMLTRVSIPLSKTSFSSFWDDQILMFHGQLRPPLLLHGASSSALAQPWEPNALSWGLHSAWVWTAFHFLEMLCIGFLLLR